MNYYPHHIGDYLRDTAHLSPLEDGIYRRMLDVYYASEKPLPLETQWVCRLVRASTNDEQKAVEEVLRQFFNKHPDGWRNNRADREIRLAAKKAKVARQNGKLGGRPKTQRVSSGIAKQKLAGNPTQSSQEPVTSNQRLKEAEAPPDGGKSVFSLGVSLLTDQGLAEQPARAFIASCLKEWAVADVEAAFRAATGKEDVKSYAMGVLNKTQKKNTAAVKVDL